jgi:ubiquinone/menaquinone biosynthesis C-methylase UbiE
MDKSPYDPISSLYALLIDPFLAWARRETAQAVRRRFGDRPNVKSNIRILEIGCGTGAQARRLARLGFEVTAIDLSWGMILQAKKKNPGELSILWADGRTLPFRSGAFDAVVMQLTLHEMGNAERMAISREILRITRQDAFIYFLDYRPVKRRTLSLGLIDLVERAAGRVHYRNGRGFLAQGGVTAFANRIGLSIENTRLYFQGSVALVEAVRKKRFK